jgi:hypothetical protein
MDLEIRTGVELSVKGKKIIGRPVVYNSRSQDLGGFVEIIAPGAFGDSINGDIRALVEHDAKMILGRSKANTLIVKEDDQGIYVEISPPNTRTASELIESINRGDISGMSFGFTVNQDGSTWDFEQTPALRTVTSANLYEVTITSLPAYHATSVQVSQRTLKEFKANKGIETYLKNLELWSL